MKFLNICGSGPPTPQYLAVFLPSTPRLHCESSFCSTRFPSSDLLTRDHVGAQQPKAHSVLKPSMVTRLCPRLVNGVDLVNLEFEVVYQRISFILPLFLSLSLEIFHVLTSLSPFPFGQLSLWQVM